MSAPTQQSQVPTTAPPLRSWQRKALVRYLATSPQDFLAVATPGAGKTTFALRVAAELLATGIVSNVTVVTPTDHLKSQWARAAASLGLALDPTFRNAERATSPEFTGIVVTYAQVGSDPLVHRRRTLAKPTLVILDEIHHAGDSRTWGDGVKIAFEEATRRLGLTGTPFRSDTNPIPFVQYERDNAGLTRSRADTVYGYGDALRDKVVRPVLFLAYSGETRWRTSAGEELSARLGEPLTADVTAHAWRTALNPRGDWMRQVLASADARLRVLREGGMSDAAGLVIAGDREHARAYAVLLGSITGDAPVVVLSDDAGASAKITQFTHSDQRWMVAVRMVSEGVDIPRLAVGVYATSVQTPLYFAQAVGRFVRTRAPGETASVFLPSVPPLLALAAALEVERDHILERPAREELLDDALLAAANREQNEADLGEEFMALEASAHLDQLIYDGASFGTAAAAGTVDEQEYLGLPGLLTPEQVSLLLSKRQREQLASAERSPKPSPQGPPATDAMPSLFEQRSRLRRQLNSLVGAEHHRTGRPHGAIHAQLRAECGGPASPQATIEQLTERIIKIRSW
ncbi:MAG TPA: DEAD/DEAH box helicase [Mycobacteriales bacterium]|nr:DEAD/DEAH box helicase [Mycobacteriales bacterium]